MAVGTDELALLDLLQNAAPIVAGNEVCNVPDLWLVGDVVPFLETLTPLEELAVIDLLLV